MATNNDQNIWKELRKPFDSKVVGTLPKPYKKDSPKGTCDECGGYHGLPAVHLDYIGHAAVTDRLLSVDPLWTWEPVALTEQGLPAYDNAGGLWIRLTVGGVTRLGYGDGPDPKQRIGDALRNAAMRFGVGLDLWTKDELESHLDAPELKNIREPDLPDDEPTIDMTQVADLMHLAKAKGYSTKELAATFINERSGMDDFTQLPVSLFEGVKKSIIEAGWKKPDAEVHV